MMWKNLAIAGSLFSAAFVIAACTISAPRGPDPAIAQAGIAKQMCDVAPLAEERSSYLRSIDGVAKHEGLDLDAATRLETPVGPVGIGGNLSAGDSVEKEGDSSYSEDRHTILLEKLLRYRAEIEANYRFVTMNCRAYNLCLERNSGGPSNCASEQGALLASQDKFNDIAYGLASLDKYRERDHEHHHPHCGDRDCEPNADCRDVHCDTEGGVFLTGCCYGDH